ncbi:MAG: tRNA uridine-5-carboxymethylaminomethyl(34) synthesis GTPase MnmE [Bacteroidetes bacterium]|nr:tRNA uridine-5-carboxymethylaminomethyl(34) synthesis GTPase MnmE [Bacteroidota bacterium]
MVQLSLLDTICAISTAPGIGAIAVARISGPLTFTTLENIFKFTNKKTSLKQVVSHTIHHGTINTADGPLDDALLSIFRAPNSYTGEDVAELSIHGSAYLQRRIMEVMVDHGLRMAGPGEFTLRAFMNGKFDLTQAEGVADVIAAHSKISHELAFSQLRGGFSKKLKSLRKQLIDFVSLLELELDFSEEDVEFADRSRLIKLVRIIKTEISSLVESFSLGNVIKTGIPVAIIGKPNVGKSTLLNAILNEEKAIVSEIPGTTRDAIEDTIVIGGYSFRFIDTAGLRAAENVIESMGIERTWQKISEASIVLYVFDATKESFEDVVRALDDFKDIADSPSRHLILVGNKLDKVKKLPKGFTSFLNQETIFVSAKHHENIHQIAESLVSKVSLSGINDGLVISNSRHYEALQHAQSALTGVETGLLQDIPADLLSSNIRNALYYLGEISGEITTDDILGNIFSRFCIGK